MGFIAKYPGRCDNCGEMVEAGELATYEDDEFIHAECAGVIRDTDRANPGNPLQTFFE